MPTTLIVFAHCVVGECRVVKTAPSEQVRLEVEDIEDFDSPLERALDEGPRPGLTIGGTS